MEELLKDKKKLLKLGLSFVVPLAVFFLRPLGMNLAQAATVSVLVLVVTWWSAGLVNKIIASCVLLGCFWLFSGAPARQVFTFLLSENFPMIALTYLFSQGIANSGIIEKIVQPFLGRFANTPLKILLCMIAVLTCTIYLVPQPLARLILVSVVFAKYIDSTNIPADTKQVLMWGCFLFYSLVNMLCVNADIILNSSTLAFAGLEMGDMQWAKNMAVPVVVYGALILALFCWVYRGPMRAVKTVRLNQPPQAVKLEKRDKLAIGIVLVTVLLWVTKGLHGINATLVTLAATVVMFATGLLKPRDLKAIDITTLVFLTAAFSIGGVMKSCGAADLIFSRLKGIFPSRYSIGYILILALVGKLMHFLLGSNTTTLSLIVPGLMLICTDVLTPEAIMYVCYMSTVVQALLPFHSVAYMMGAASGYFDTKILARFGLPMLVLMFLALVCVFLPWWHVVGIV